MSIPFRETSPPVEEPHGSTLVFFEGALRLARKDFGVLGGSTYNDWFDAGAHAWTECNAYGVSIACANELSASNHCSATGTPSQCCTEVADYLTNMRAQQTSWCASAPATLPICPFAPRVDTPRSTLPPGEAYA